MCCVCVCVVCVCVCVCDLGLGKPLAPRRTAYVQPACEHVCVYVCVCVCVCVCSALNMRRHHPAAWRKIATTISSPHMFYNIIIATTLSSPHMFYNFSQPTLKTQRLVLQAIASLSPSKACGLDMLQHPPTNEVLYINDPPLHSGWCFRQLPVYHPAKRVALICCKIRPQMNCCTSTTHLYTRWLVFQVLVSITQQRGLLVLIIDVVARNGTHQRPGRRR